MKNLKPKFLHYFAISIFILYIIPYIISWDNSFLRIADGLDDNPTYILSQYTNHTSIKWNDEIPFLMSGVKRSSMPTDMNLVFQLYKIFNHYTVELLNILLTRIIGFLGMYLLIRKHILKTKNSDFEYIIIGVAISFSILPFFTNFWGSITIQPLLLYSFLNIRNNKSSWVDWLIIGFTPFYSKLVLAGVFFIAFIIIIQALDFFKKGKINLKYILGVLFLTLIYIIVNHRLFLYAIFENNFISHRTEFLSFTENSIYSRIMASINIFLYGNWHAPTHNRPFILISILLTIPYFLKKNKTIIENRITKVMFHTIIFVFLICILYGLSELNIIKQIISGMPLLNEFQYDRFYFLLPLLFYILFSISLFIIHEFYSKGNLIAISLIILQISLLFTNHEFIKEGHQPTFKQFYAKAQFNDIKNYIDKPIDQYKVASIGIHPAISSVNGFHTADGYSNIYPLEYKIKFRKVIQNELLKNSTVKNYFDNWGSRCYIFTDELGINFMNTKDKNNKLNNLDLNTPELSLLGVEYLLSSVEIKNYKEINLIFEKLFQNNESAWDIYLYRL